MSDTLVILEPVTTLIEAISGDTIVTTDVTTELVAYTSTDTLLVTDASTSMVETVETEIVVGQQEVVVILSECTQGPQGASGLDAPQLNLEAGEALAIGDPVRVSANKLYKASNLDQFGVIALVTVAAAAGFLATATTMGVVPVVGLVAGNTYFLGVGELVAVAPVIGNVVRMGYAVSTVSFILNIEEPVLLAA